MSTPPVTVREKERALSLVEILKKTGHNGFPVVDEHGRFKGLVRRKQIVALVEYGIFEKVDSGEDSISRSIVESNISVRSNSKNNNQELMNYAYHIKDNRYDNVLELTEDEELATFAPSQELSGKKIRNSGKRNIGKSMDPRHLLGGDVAMLAVDVTKLNSNNFIRDDDLDAGIDGGGDDIDSDDEENDKTEDLSNNSYYKGNENDVSSNECNEDPILLSNSVIGGPKEFARVGRDRNNNVVVISWLNPEFKDYVIDLEAVMNLGTYIVPEHFPLSKAYSLFTLLGLRWIVVVGGIDNGTVVGLLTRESFLESYLKLKTGG